MTNEELRARLSQPTTLQPEMRVRLKSNAMPIMKVMIKPGVVGKVVGVVQGKIPMADIEFDTSALNPALTASKDKKHNGEAFTVRAIFCSELEEVLQ